MSASAVLCKTAVCFCLDFTDYPIFLKISGKYWLFNSIYVIMYSQMH